MLNDSTLNNFENQLDFVLEKKLAQVNTCLPCKITKVGDELSVKPLLKQKLENGGQIDYPEIHGVVILEQSSGYASIEIERKVGDLGFVVFCQRDITSVRKGKDTTPSTNRRFSLSDGVWIGGYGNTGTAKIKLSNNKIQIEVNGENIIEPIIGAIDKLAEILATKPASIGAPIDPTAPLQVLEYTQKLTSLFGG